MQEMTAAESSIGRWTLFDGAALQIAVPTLLYLSSLAQKAGQSPAPVEVPTRLDPLKFGVLPVLLESTGYRWRQKASRLRIEWYGCSNRQQKPGHG